VDGWAIRNFHYSSIDGASWQISRESIMQLEIFATPVPEPSTIALVGLGGAFSGIRLFRRPGSKRSAKPPAAN
jgi:hypothetical protein